MPLWREWLTRVRELRPACARTSTFCWMTVVLVGLCARPDLAGVTSFVRALWLRPRAYRRLLHLFHTPALDLQKLTAGWIRLTSGTQKIWPRGPCTNRPMASNECPKMKVGLELFSDCWNSFLTAGI